MSVKKYKFVSPGVFVNEIDNSQLPRTPDAMGPVIIGQSQKGPNLVPVEISSFLEYIEVFGEPQPGNGTSGDSWRDYADGSPTYGAYAAQAYLKNASPVTFVKLAGLNGSTATTKAGWKVPSPSTTTNGGTYGLFVAPVKSPDYTLFQQAVADAKAQPTAPDTTLTDVVDNATNETEAALKTAVATAFTNLSGAKQTAQENIDFKDAIAALNVPHRDFKLGAIFYLNDGSIELHDHSVDGSTIGGGGTFGGQNAVVEVSTPKWKISLCDNYAASGTGNTIIPFTFNTGDTNYIRKVFNTSPTATNASVTPAASLKKYWLGQTFESDIHKHLNVTGATGYQAVLLPIGNGTQASDYGLNESELTSPSSPWVFSSVNNIPSKHLYDFGNLSSPPTSMENLFRFHSIHGAEWEQKNYKISIEDIKASTTELSDFGSFSVVVRKVSDSDSNPVVLERFANLSLDPNSNNYIAMKIGDKENYWDEAEKRYRTRGSHNNQSKYIRVEVADSSLYSNSALPFGFRGPERSISSTYLTAATKSTDGNTFADKANLPSNSTFAAKIQFVGTASSSSTVNATFSFPSFPLRTKSFISGENLSSPTDAYFGVTANRYESSGPTSQIDQGYGDYTYSAKYIASEPSFIFSLDDIVVASDGTATWTAGSYSEGNSKTVSGAPSDILDSGYNKFTLPLFGGFDGLDITEKSHFNNTRMTSEASSYLSVKRAINSVSDPEMVEMNMLSAPGITNSGLTGQMVSLCEQRADALAIIDIEGDYVPSHENTSSEDSRVANPSTAVSNLKARAFNSSYGACFYPSVVVQDDINNASVIVPPSVAMLGVFASTQAKSELWFAPAGFTRGGLSANGAAGLSVTDIKYSLSSKERDKLYDVNINPIASFPNEGIVVFGQKTLQVTPSALDRINVRRLMIYVKKEISRMASTLLFEPNVEDTWANFLHKVNPFLNDVQSKYGLTDYRVILDESTTTDELVDRNIMYAKVFLKPARAIEFIAIDFSITNSGASFDDL